MELSLAGRDQLRDCGRALSVMMSTEFLFLIAVVK